MDRLASGDNLRDLNGKFHNFHLANNLATFHLFLLTGIYSGGRGKLLHRLLLMVVDSLGSLLVCVTREKEPSGRTKEVSSFSTRISGRKYLEFAYANISERETPTTKSVV